MGHTEDFSSRGVDAGFTYIIIGGAVQVMLTCARLGHQKFQIKLVDIGEVLH